MKLNALHFWWSQNLVQASAVEKLSFAACKRMAWAVRENWGGGWQEQELGQRGKQSLPGLWPVEVAEGREAPGAFRTLHSCQLMPAGFPGAVSACLSLLSTALTVLMCATEWSGYLKVECSKGSPLTAGLLNSPCFVSKRKAWCWMGGIRGGLRHWLLRGSWLRGCWMFILCCLFLCLCLCWFLSPEVPPFACGSLSATSSYSALKITRSWIKVKLKTGPILLETHSTSLGEALSCRKKMYKGQGIMRTARVVFELMCILWVFPGKTECAGLLCEVGSECSCLGEQIWKQQAPAGAGQGRGCMAWYKQYLGKVCGFYSSSCVSWALQTVLLFSAWLLVQVCFVPGSCRDTLWSQK